MSLDVGMGLDVDAVVDYIKQHAAETGEVLGDTKLNCLLYLAQGHCLAATGRPLFNASIFAGPEHPEVICQCPRIPEEENQEDEQ